MRGRRRVVRGSESPDAGGLDLTDRGRRPCLRRPWASDRDVTRSTFLQKQLCRLYDGFGMEPRPHGTIQQGISDGDDRHALMMRHEGAHDRNAVALRQSGWCVVQGFIEAVAATSADRGKSLEISSRCGRVDHGCQRRGIRRDDDVFPKTAFQPQAGNTEVRILIGEFQITDVVRGFGHAPRDSKRGSIFDLAMHDQPTRPLDQAAGRCAHHERRHQILEHRSRPGDQRGAMRDRRNGATEPEPVARGNVALRDCHEAGEPRLGGEKIVAAGVERAVGHPVSDREQLAVLIEQKPEVHGKRHRAGLLLHGQQTLRKRCGCIPLQGEIATVALNAGARRLYPEQHVRAGVVPALQRQRRSNIHHRLCLGRKFGKKISDAFAVRWPSIHARLQKAERVVELIPRYSLSAPAVAQLLCLVACKREGIFDSGKTPGVRERQIAPLPARIGERDQMRGQIAAVDGGDVLRIERSQVPCAVPIVEMTAKAGEIAHGR